MNWENTKYLIFVFGTLMIALFLTMILRKGINTFIIRYSKKLKADPTNFSFIKNSISFVIFSIAIIFIFIKIPFLKSLGTALFAGAGIIAAIVGFASQKAFANIISGFFILVFKPFRIDDTIEVMNQMRGRVEEITLRHTVIKDYENRRIIIPNNLMSEETIINSSITDEKMLKHVEIGISYDSDIDKAMAIFREEAAAHPFCLDERTDEDKKNNLPVVMIRLTELSTYAVILRAYIWTSSAENAFIMKCDLLKTIKQRFDHEGIEIPYPHYTLINKGIHE